ncbi:MAG: putative Ig domain-containing protein [Planctomycetes bacterium]|jgi:hypothetical protein|nr:putative Ig domain-containing protein [Planctomycetota bacterium]
MMKEERFNKICLFYGFIHLFFVLLLIWSLDIWKGAASVSAQNPPDAIAIRIYPNPDHVSPLRWYRKMGFGGSPQSLTVDGYEAVRDGQTVYVNAGNVDDDVMPSVLYTNIYVIAYTLGAEKATKDIFSQILVHWTFNTNLRSGETWGGAAAVCSLDSSTRCLTDKECEKKGYCNSAKSQVTRDTIRLSRLYDIDYLLLEYGRKHGYYPTLGAGTYMPQISLSVWPSWQNALGLDLASGLPVDPINKLIACDSRFNPLTCWDERAKEFAWTPEINSATLPPGNFTFLYKYGTAVMPKEYTLCAFSETGKFPDPSKMCNQDCLPACYNKECGDNGCGDANGCGICPPGETCRQGRCVFGCGTGPGCRESLRNGRVVAGYCDAGRCYDCENGYNYAGGICVCSPSCNAAGQPGCQTAAPANSSRAFGRCCNPGELCYECPYGTTWNGSICEQTCTATCSTTGQPNCRTTAPANSKLGAGACCTAGQRCYECQTGYVWDSLSESCLCPPVTLDPIASLPTYYARPVAGEVYKTPTLFSYLVTLTDSQKVTYSLSGQPGWLIISPSTGQIQGEQTADNSANVYNITVRAQNICGLSGSTNFTLTVQPNEWCGDSVWQPAKEACEFAGNGTSATDQWACLDCTWQGGFCGNDLCDIFYESYIDDAAIRGSCPEDCKISIYTDFTLCTESVEQPVCYSGSFPTPTLFWSVTPSSAQAAFAIEISDEFDFPRARSIYIGPVTSTNNFYTFDRPGLNFGFGLPANLMDGYFWRVKIMDVFGTWSQWQECVGPFDTVSRC